MIRVEDRRMDNEGCGTNGSSYFLESVSRVYERLIAPRLLEPYGYDGPILDDMKEPKFQNWLTKIGVESSGFVEMFSMFKRNYLDPGFGKESMPPKSKVGKVDKVVPSKFNRRWFEDAYNVIHNFIVTPRVSHNGWTFYSPMMVGVSGSGTSSSGGLFDLLGCISTGCWDTSEEVRKGIRDALDGKTSHLEGLPASLTGATYGCNTFYVTDMWLGERRTGDPWYNYAFLEPIGKLYDWIGGGCVGTFVDYLNEAVERAGRHSLTESVAQIGMTDAGIFSEEEMQLKDPTDPSSTVLAAICAPERTGSGRFAVSEVAGLKTHANAVEVPSMRLSAPSVYRMRRLAAIASMGGLMAKDALEYGYFEVPAATDEMRMRFPHHERTWRAAVIWKLRTEVLPGSASDGGDLLHWEAWQDVELDEGAWGSPSKVIENQLVGSLRYYDEQTGEVDVGVSYQFDFRFGDIQGALRWDTTSSGCVLVLPATTSSMSPDDAEYAFALQMLFGCSGVSPADIRPLFRVDLSFPPGCAEGGTRKVTCKATLPIYNSLDDPFSKSYCESPDRGFPIRASSNKGNPAPPRFLAALRRDADWRGIEGRGHETHHKLYVGTGENHSGSYRGFFELMWEMFHSEAGELRNTMEAAEMRAPLETAFDFLPKWGDLLEYMVDGGVGCIELNSQKPHIDRVEDGGDPPSGTIVYYRVGDHGPLQPIVNNVVVFDGPLVFDILGSIRKISTYDLLESSSTGVYKDFMVKRDGSAKYPIPADTSKFGKFPEYTKFFIPEITVTAAPTVFMSYGKAVDP